MDNLQFIAQNFAINKFNLKENLGLLTIALAVLWRPITLWYIHIDSAARIPLFFFLLSFILLYKEIVRYTLRRPVTLYMFVAIYMVINGFVNDSGKVYEKDGNYLILTHILEPILSMMITIVLARKNFKQTLKWLSWILLFFCILCLRNSGYDEDNRMNAEINANEIAIHCAICFGLLLLQFIRNKGWTSRSFIIFAFIPIYIIMNTGSRMALGMSALMVLFAWLSKHGNINLKNIILIIIFGGALAYIGNYVIENTMIGDRLMSTTEQGEELEMTTGTVLDYYGDRGLQYYFSWPYFLENPYTGIGFHKWPLYSPTGLVCHSEYMVQYVECGLIAFVPYVLFLLSLFKILVSNFRHRRGKKQQSTSIILIALLLSIVFSNTVLWSYNIHAVFIIYGLAFAYPKYVKNNNET